SRAFAESLGSDPKLYPDAVIILDMIGDSDLNIYKEQNSDETLSAEIWEQAVALGYPDYFIPEVKFAILDDHIPFLELGIPAVDIIDFDYPYYHTTNDTLDKVSAESLQIVGETIFAWLTNSP
ncbi:MAG: M28 family peptidase, partial [Anaerolineales bacterium]|nr:M28 family peptidase [Anaerolineales bacterium]